MEFLITTIVAVILLVGVVSSCPSVCRCTENANGLDVDCSNRGLDSIPTDLPNNTYSFYLYSNQITSIQVGTLENLKSLTVLYLHSNQITSNQEGTFNNLTSLTHLELHSNQITSLLEGTFNNLTSLTELYVHYNQITSIQVSTFKDLTKLTTLDLRYNQITSILEGTFSNLTNLSYLYFHYNQITSIQSGAFNDLPRLPRLLLRRNPISFVSENAFQNLPQLISLEFDMHCIDCNNIPFWRWLKRNQTFSKSVTCNDYDGEKLSSLTLNDFTGCIITSQSDVQSTTDHTLNIIYAVIGTFIVTTLVCVTVFLAILRYRRGKTEGDTNRRNGQNTSGYLIDAFTNDYANIGNINAESHYEATILSAQEQTYYGI